MPARRRLSKLLLPSGEKSLSLQISTRLVAAALLVSLLEIIAVLILYSGNRQKLAEQLIGLHVDRISEVVVAATSPADRAAKLAALAPPSGTEDWRFTVHDGNRQLLFASPVHDATAFADLPSPIDLDWTRREPPRKLSGEGELIYGSRHVVSSSVNLWITMGIKADGVALFVPVFLREAFDHVILPVAPVTLLLLVVNLYIVRRMLAPLAASAIEVDALDPSRMDARLHVPTTPQEVRTLVLAVNRALDRLEHTMTTLQAFTADAAHEMRTPLAVLSLRIDALENSPTKRLLRDDVAAMTRLVNQMLDLAQADTLDIPADRRVDPSQLARDVVAQMLPMAIARGCDIELIDHGGASVIGHAEALARVLRNLIDNAIAHSPSGRTIDVTAGPGAHIAVRDRGPGIPPDLQPNLFRRFWRGPARGRDGAGLGLAIARSVLTRHGATITAGNASDGGAVFSIDWPDQPHT